MKPESLWRTFKTLPTTNSPQFVAVTRADGVLVKEPIIASPTYLEDITARNTAQMKAIISCPAIRTEIAMFNVIGIDLGGVRQIESVEITCLLRDAALGVVSIVGIGPK